MTRFGRQLFSALGLDSGVIALVGAGGKKTTMYALAKHHPGRVMLSSTSHMYPYEKDQIDRLLMCGAEPFEYDLATHERVCAFASPTDTPKRIGGLSAAQIERILDRGSFDLCVIKCDGARARWVKAPAAHEPIIPTFADLVVPVVSVQAVGRALDDRIAHRPELIAAVSSAAAGEPLQEAHLARLLASPHAALKDVGTARVVPLINMADDAHWMTVAKRIAALSLEQTTRFEHVICAAMKHEVLEVVSR